MPHLVTGSAGFIGFHVARLLLDDGYEVVGIDNLNDYYDVSLKLSRLAELTKHDRFRFEKIDISDAAALSEVFADIQPTKVIHLAAQAGVRYSMENPSAYAQSNLIGFVNLLEDCRRHSVEHLVFASSSSVYGANTEMPFNENQHTDHPVSLYGATKKSNEMMAHAYAHVYGLPVTGLRFFTVYGPWGRPDMSPMIFAERILSGKAIDVFNDGNHSRDFTYIDDIAAGVVRLAEHVASASPDWNSHAPVPATSSAPYRIFNIGNGAPVKLLDFICELEHAFKKRAVLNLLPMQPGDVVDTFADTSSLNAEIGFRPAMSIADGVERFVAWYRSYYAV